MQASQVADATVRTSSDNRLTVTTLRGGLPSDAEPQDCRGSGMGVSHIPEGSANPVGRQLSRSTEQVAPHCAVP